MLQLCLVVLLLGATSHVEGAKKAKGAPVQDGPILYEEYGYDQSIIEDHRVWINAVKMAKAVNLTSQNAVSTCRYVLFKTFKSVYDAEESCNNLKLPMTIRIGGGLATIKSEEENRDLVTLLKVAFGVHWTPDNSRYNRKNWAWVGLQKTRNNSEKIPLKLTGIDYYDYMDYQWPDGSHPPYANWMKKNPDQAYDKKTNSLQLNVALSKTGAWDDTYGFVEMPYVCNYCGKYVVIPEHVSWTRARELCEDYGLTMAKIDSNEDNEDLAEAARMTLGTETATKRWDNSNWIWIGEMLTADGTGWEHHDGSPLLWDSPTWDFKGQPDDWINNKGEEQVVAFSRINNKWDDSFISNKRPFACMCPESSCSEIGSS